MSILLNVSIGEALDKLTILDIKCEILSGNKYFESKKEYDMIYEKTEQYINKYIFYYKCLKYINKKIWEMQDNVKKMSTTDNNFNNLWNKITIFNDIRFRLKNKINIATNSDYKEQKGYDEKIKKIIVATEYNNLEQIINIVRYISICYDYTYVYTDYDNEIKKWFNDDKTIYVLSKKTIEKSDDECYYLNDLNNMETNEILNINEFDFFYKNAI
ncbi:hypothetical protein BMW23_0564 [Bodo saltans virus]|uniref:Uncharacterized protein n=1 Tax=Bodo saltans virus TaxID=2024608 RepID=A0A2H4UUJ8_9VIRU|nr:hypothetical protein QJ851_gp0548 [Bodo saltans virus]ATZ80611.1 hypothetical protein BMW23_0564 [Bodo saltans virus]